MAKKLSDLIGQFATIPNSFILASSVLSTESKWLFVILRYHTNSKTGNAFPSYTTIQQITGFHRKTIAKSLKELENAGWLTKQRRFGATTIYALQIPSSSISDTTETASSSLNSTISSITSATISSSDGVHANQTEEGTRSSKPDKEPSAHARLMDFHASHLRGEMPDGAAQGAAAKWLLERYSMEAIKECYERLSGETWRSGGVTLLTVKKMISQQPRAPQNGNGKAARTYEWQGRYYALDEIVSDDGERYTIMGADGTPTKRWHTLEAFAADKGITPEQAKYGMGA